MKAILYTMIAAFLSTGCVNGYVSVDAKQFAEAIKDPQMQIVDARTPQEFKDGHIPGAVNIDINSKDFTRQTGSLDKARPVAVYCRSGRRSNQAANRMLKEGLKVFDMKGGIIEWQKAGLPIVK